MIKGIVFDVDGVILDSMWIWREVMRRFFSQYNVEAEVDIMDKIVQMNFDESSNYIKDHYKIPRTPEEILEEIFAITRDFYDNEIELKPGVLNYLNEFKKRGIRMAAATASDRSYIEAGFKRLGIYDFFDSIMTTRELGVAKTEPTIYLKSAEAIGAGPDEFVVFEDALYAIDTCHKAGIKVVAVYDAKSESDEAEIRRKSDLYLENYDSFDLFLSCFNL